MNERRIKEINLEEVLGLLYHAGENNESKSRGDTF